MRKSGIEILGLAFHFLYTELCPHFHRANIVQKPLSVEERLAITLWRLGTNIELSSTAHLFGVGLSTVCIIVREVYCHC